MKPTFSSVDLMILVHETKAILEKMTPEKRVEFLSFTHGYCRYCGYEDLDGTCSCSNDE